jgi:hypothetical protein
LGGRLSARVASARGLSTCAEMGAGVGVEVGAEVGAQARIVLLPEASGTKVRASRAKVLLLRAGQKGGIEVAQAGIVIICT